MTNHTIEIAAGVRSVGLLAAKSAVEQDFYASLRDRGLKVIVPDAYGRELIERIIDDELRRGQLADSSRKALLDEIGALGLRGADAVVLGCAEFGDLIGAHNSPLPIFV